MVCTHLRLGEKSIQFTPYSKQPSAGSENVGLKKIGEQEGFDVTFPSARSENKNAFIERLWRTLRVNAARQMEEDHRLGGSQAIVRAAQAYNDSVHSTTGFRPNELTDQRKNIIAIDNIRRRQWEQQSRSVNLMARGPKFKMGDKVYLREKHRSAFRKANERTFDTDIDYEIVGVNETSSPVTSYYIKADEPNSRTLSYSVLESDLLSLR